jgi:hypothetical protein
MEKLFAPWNKLIKVEHTGYFSKVISWKAWWDQHKKIQWNFKTCETTTFVATPIDFGATSFGEER